jgi:ABC-type sulfate transport system substrate-binding protein
MPRIPVINLAAVLASFLAIGLIVAKKAIETASTDLLNVSYDPTREQ